MSAESGNRSASIGYDEKWIRGDVHDTSGNKSKAEETEEPRLDTGGQQSAQDFEALGRSHLQEFRQNGTLNDLEKSIECFSCALTLTPDDHPDISRRHAGLGVSYGDRYRRLGELTDLEKAIECDTCALALTPDSHPDISERHASLGVSYTERYQRLGELTDLKKAMECLTRAL
ncbi:unnamed protein product, partial [Rhizoctonia solani]